LPPIISPLHFTPILTHYSNFLPLWYTYISPNHFNALKTPQKRPAFMVAPFIGGKLHPIGGKKRPIFSVSLRHPPPTKIWWVIRQDTDTDTARTRPVLKLAKRQDNLELSYLCSTFVLLMEWQERKTRTRARQGKARKSGVVTTPRHGKFTHKASQFTTWRCTTYNLELSYLCHTFVLLK